jgi:hypothetical protein
MPVCVIRALPSPKKRRYITRLCEIRAGRMRLQSVRIDPVSTYSSLHWVSRSDQARLCASCVGAVGKSGKAPHHRRPSLVPSSGPWSRLASGPRSCYSAGVQNIMPTVRFPIGFGCHAVERPIAGARGAVFSTIKTGGCDVHIGSINSWPAGFCSSAWALRGRLSQTGSGRGSRVVLHE